MAGVKGYTVYLMNEQHIEAQSVVVPKGRKCRVLDVRPLAESIAEKGMDNAITVVRHGVKYRLVSGCRRLRAIEMLGLTNVRAIVLEVFEAESKLAEIDERMRRVAEGLQRLTLLEQGEQLAYRRELYEGACASTDFLTDAALKTGLSESVLKKRIQIGRDIDPSVRDRIRGTPLANHPRLLELSRVEAEKQMEAAKALLAGALSAEFALDQSRPAPAPAVSLSFKRTTPEMAERIVAFRLRGANYMDIAEGLGVGESRVADVCQRHIPRADGHRVPVRQRQSGVVDDFVLKMEVMAETAPVFLFPELMPKAMRGQLKSALAKLNRALRPIIRGVADGGHQGLEVHDEDGGC
jgi:ParB-like chromosome segregation protein Spo0J